MRIHFQAVPWDLYAAVAYVVAASAALLALGTGSLLGDLLVLFVPGYLLTAALLPRAGDADVILRVALSVGLSLALGAFVGVVLDFTPWGITFASVTVALLLLSLGLASLAYRARMRAPPQERLKLSLTFRPARWAEYSLVEKLLAVGVVALLVVMVPLTGMALLEPRPTQPFTELYLLGPTGNLTGYPSRLNVSEPGTVWVVVANHEAATVTYNLRVDLVGVRIFFNKTSRANETIELNRTTLSSNSFVEPDGSTWTQPYSFSIAEPGTWEVQFLLFRTANLETLYRSVDLLVVVT